MQTLKKKSVGVRSGIGDPVLVGGGGGGGGGGQGGCG